MAVFKCKMCGGELNLIEDTTVCECEYCGTTQTVPSADNEKKMNLFNRANRLRFTNEFDKAAGVFESIVAEFPEEAEAYWGLVLCKYGIEYVDDPATAKKVPTCHRTSYDGIFEDDNFQMALEYADPIANRVYREEAKEIDRLQKAILEVAEKEEPFDVFICYKETEEDDQRTKDSVLAQDMYDALTAKGYKVFFSRISLEDKLGQEYEPYIFAALNSARVMLAVGTKYEYFNAVWVKNEWARFLELIKKDKSKVLIPCYCDIDAYDMPLEFKNLQGQDMSKVGFIQDLVRGVEKIIPLKKEPEKADEQVVQVASGPNVASLLERAALFLEDEDWDSVEEYCDKVLDIEPKNVIAYLYQTCANYRIQNANELIAEDDFENSDSFKKAYRFADEKMKLLLDEIVMKANIHRGEEEKRKQAVKKNKKSQLIEIRKALNSENNLVQSRGAYMVGLKSNGRVVATGDDNVSRWADIISIACSLVHTVGLKADGRVVATGDNSDGQCNVSEWTDIVSIACAQFHTVGLKADGDVVATGFNKKGNCNVSDWTDIISIACGLVHTVGLKADGRVVATGDNSDGQCNVSEWTDIVSIACGDYHTVGLKADGRVVATGDDNVSRWADIISIACSLVHTVGLKADGRVVATGDNSDGQCNVSEWTDIVSIACGDYHTVGLKADGDVVATGDNSNGQCNVSEWTDIVSIACGLTHTEGLKADGSIVTTSDANVGSLKLFENQDQLNEMLEKRAKGIEERKQKAEETRRERKQLEEETRREKKRLEEERRERRSRNVCQHCGGEFKGMLIKKCTQCGKGKDY